MLVSMHDAQSSQLLTQSTESTPEIKLLARTLDYLILYCLDLIFSLLCLMRKTQNMIGKLLKELFKIIDINQPTMKCLTLITSTTTL